eukprot:TRINITY_DN36284_c0_g1_i1.p1 TRINITY_DN36284_c0_g1~~TRINITY_DN36284_c0_g1_i1.p1  ORF type:complete len:1770 (+),score=222.22 TRINITY_DN36284_c0_g1_i1:44-5353(+)
MTLAARPPHREQPPRRPQGRDGAAPRPTRERGLELPTKHDFGFCPVKEETRHTFTVRNTSSASVDYLWEVPSGQSGQKPPFVVQPTQGRLKPMSQLQLTVTFRPVEASVFVAALICRHDANTSVMKVSGVGKYPFVRASVTSLTFGDVLLGSAAERTVRFTNQSVVPAKWRVTRTDRDLENPFVFHPAAGVIPPESQVSVRVRYTPQSSGVTSSDDFRLVTPGGNSIDVGCCGTAVGPDVVLSSSSVHFQEVDVNGPPPPPRVVMLTNRTACPAYFQILQAVPGCAFTVSPVSSAIGPNRSTNVTVTFRPTEPINYFRRLFVVVGGSTTPLSMDVMGTGVTDRVRPPPFTHARCLEMLCRSRLGLGRLTPDDINATVQRMKAGDEETDVDADTYAARDALMHSLDPPKPTVKTLLTEMMTHSAVTTDMSFSLDESSMEFGAARKRGTESRVVHVRNHTATKATAVWVTPPNSSFDVTPATQDVPRFGSAAFNVRAVSGNAATYRSHVLECYTFFKTMRSHKLAEEPGIVPPQCLLLRCGSHTFLSDDHFPAKLRLSTSHVIFPAAHQGDTSHQMIVLHNDGDTPARYEAVLGEESSQGDNDAPPVHDPVEAMYMDLPAYEQKRESNLSLPSSMPEARQGRVFDVYPPVGVVAAGSHQILTLRFRPNTATVHRCAVDFVLNYSSKQNITLQLEGSAFVPSLVLSNDATLFFKPTAVGATSTRSYMIENPCRVIVRYEFEIPAQWSKVLKVDNNSGVLKGNEKKAIRFHFTPDRARKCLLQVPVMCMGADTVAEITEKQRLNLTVLAEGTAGTLSLEPPSLDFGTVLVSDHQTQEITLFNSSSCDTSFMMGWLSDTEEEMPPDILSFSTPMGVVPARSHLLMRVHFKPHHRQDFKLRIHCRVLSDSLPEGAWAAASKRQPTPAELSLLPTCLVKASGGQPVLEIVDVRCITISKAHLWQQMNVDPINEALRMDTDANDHDRGQFEFKTLCSMHPHFQVDFGAAVQNTPPTCVLVTVCNISRIPADFEFLLPSDSAVPAERWFHEESPTEDDVHQEHIIDNQFFAVEPRQGRVPPGGKVTIELSYKHKSPEAHKLPVVLNIDRGRRAVLDFTGRTLRQDERWLDLVSLVHSFVPVAIGDLDAPTQYFELRNASHIGVSYELAAEPFQQACAESFDFPVFQCLNSYGDIPPLSSVLLRWCFRPLEAKEYCMHVPIMIQDGPSYTVEFRGRGYHPKRASAEELQAMAAEEFLPIHPLPAFKAEPKRLPVMLSADVLCFGRVPVHSLHRRMLTVRNRHPSDAFIFEWKTELQHGDQIVEVQPPSGRIAPGDHIVCKLSFYGGPSSQIIEQSIQCHVLNDDLRLRRLAAREAFEEQQRMNLDPADEDMQSTRSPVLSATVQSSMGPGSVRKSRKKPPRVPVTQPPPKYQTTAQLKLTMQRLIDMADPGNLDEDDDDLVWMDVQPTALDVRLQARVMTFDAHRLAAPEGWQRQFMPTLAVYQEHVDQPPPPPEPGLPLLRDATLGRPSSTLSQSELQQQATVEESEFAQNLIAGLLQEAVHDPAIGEAYLDIDEFPAPYYYEQSGAAAQSPPGSSVSLNSTRPPTPKETAAEDEEPTSTNAAVAAFPVDMEVEVPTGEVGIVVGHARGRVGVELRGGERRGFVPGVLKDPGAAIADAARQKRKEKRAALRQQLEHTMSLRESEHRTSQERALLQSGSFQCMVEEVFEGILFDVVKDAALDPADPTRSLVPARKPRLRVSMAVPNTSPSQAGVSAAGS